MSATDSAGNVGTASETVTVDNVVTATSCPTTAAGMTQLSGNVTLATSQSGWTGIFNSRSVVSRVEPAGGGYGSAWALQVEPKSGDSGIAGVNNAPLWVPGSPGAVTTAGAIYAGSAFVRASVPGEQVSLEIRETTPDGGAVSYHKVTVTLSDTGWHQITSTYTALHSGDAIHYGLRGNNFAGSGQNLLADCLSLQTGS